VRKTFDSPATVPAPVGPYSHAVRLDLGDGALLMLSGQLALDDAGQLVGAGSMKEQTTRIFEIIGAILDAHGATFDDVVNVRTFLLDVGQLREYGAVRRTYLTGGPPTSTTVEVSRLAVPGALVEVEVVAATSAR
jgi:enamine deaminase RidA (YjgF/YER057c/UK114 family)